jgi:hypothetical protein
LRSRPSFRKRAQDPNQGWYGLMGFDGTVDEAHRAATGVFGHDWEARESDFRGGDYWAARDYAVTIQPNLTEGEVKYRAVAFPTLLYFDNLEAHTVLALNLSGFVSLQLLERWVG